MIIKTKSGHYIDAGQIAAIQLQYPFNNGISYLNVWLKGNSESLEVARFAYSESEVAEAYKDKLVEAWMTYTEKEIVEV